MSECAHCWHTHEALLSNPPQSPQTCCRCGETRIRKSLGEGLRDHHGPFMPSGPNTVRVKIDLEAELNEMLEAMSKATGLTKQQIIRTGLGLPEDLPGGKP